MPQGQPFFYAILTTFWICYHAKLAFMLMILYQTVNTTTNAELLQRDINTIYEQSIKLKMLFTEKRNAKQLPLEE